MLKLPIDQDELLRKMTAEAVKKGEEVRATVRDLTLKSLHGREMTLAQIKGALRAVTEGVNVGVANTSMDAEKLLTDALAGMDDALLKAVEANRVALQKLTDEGHSFEDSKMKKALDELERYEDTFLRTVKQASAGASDKVRAQWAGVLKSTKMAGTDTGAKVAATVEQYAAQFQSAIRDSRTAGLKAAHAMTRNYATLVSGVLIGLSEALRQSGTGKARAAAAAPAGSAKAPAARPAANKAARKAAKPAAKKAAKPAAKKAVARKATAKKAVSKKAAAKKRK
ncbi:MAG: hypothetical protein IPI73_00395 [Betaproteobacteria bacterium]|nr:hypothetical protein [Betaproteobacteria bacterium]